VSKASSSLLVWDYRHRDGSMLEYKVAHAAQDHLLQLAQTSRSHDNVGCAQFVGLFDDRLSWLTTWV